MKHKNYNLSHFVLMLIILMTVQPNTFKAQINLGGLPKSFAQPLPELIPELNLPNINLQKLKAEDKQEDKTNSPLRFAVPVEVNLNLQNSGVWNELPNGDRVWRLKIHAPQAISINFLYDQFFLPQGGLLYIYNSTKSEVLGAFAAHNNKPHGKFATALIHDDTAILEYYEPQQVQGQGIISIGQIGHGYRSIDELVSGNAKNSGDCQVDINCSPEGDNWQEAKNSVTRIVMDGAFLCTGTLVNNSSFDQTPYVLSSDHCLNFNQYDALTNPDLGGFIFYWNYERPSCASNETMPLNTTVGATLVANSEEDALYGSDFALMLLEENPAEFFDVHFAGFDASGSATLTTACIHHPMGDLKKIATANAVPTALIYNRYWQILWDQTPNGHSITEGGSSGSALFNSNQQIIGQLYGGANVNCADPINDWAVFGRLAHSWENNGASSSKRRLKDWLDPVNLGEITILEGMNADLSVQEDCKYIFISEYLEGSGLNRCVEIFNPYSTPVNLAEGAYQLRFYFEGNTSPGTIINLMDTIPAYSTYVVCDDGADTSLLNKANLIAHQAFFNGDDAIELLKGSIPLDCFGTIGEDPGNEWGTGLTSTKNNVLRRKTGILLGDRNPSDQFTPSDEWDGAPADEFNDFGLFECDCRGFKCPLPQQLEVASCTSGLIELEVDLDAGQLTGPGLEGNFFSPNAAGPGEHQFQYTTETDTCIGTIIVRDITAPVVVGQQYTLLYQGEDYYLQDIDVIDYTLSTEDCGQFQLIHIEPEVITCDDVGQTIAVQFLVEDEAGNETEGTALITVAGSGQLPTGWFNTDIGTSNAGAIIGDPCETNPQLQVQSSAYTSNSEHGHFVYQQLCGDGSIEVEITHLSGNGFAGVMLREGLQSGVKMISLASRFSPFIYQKHRSDTDGSTSIRSIFRPGAKWLKLERNGSLITGYSSSNGSSWQIAFSQFMELGDCLEAGVFSQTNSTNNPFIATFNHLLLNGNEEAGILANPYQGNNTASANWATLQVFPNPVHDELRLQLTQDKASHGMAYIEIRNLQGQLIWRNQTTINAINNHKIPVDHLNAGIYFLSVTRNNKQTTSKFLKH